MMTTIDTKQWIREARARGARAVLLVWDTYPWPWELYDVPIFPGEDIAARFAEYDGVNMQRVAAVHLLPTSINHGPDR